MRCKDKFGGRGGAVCGNGEMVQLGGSEGVSESRDRHSRSRLWRRCNWLDINGAECLSPVQRVISTKSRLWFRRPRRLSRAGSERGLSGSMDRWV